MCRQWLPADATMECGEAGWGWHRHPAVRSFAQLSPWLFQDPASLPLCSLGCSWLESEGYVWGGKAACDTGAQSLPSPCARISLLTPHPMCPPPKHAVTPLPQGCPSLLATPGLDPTGAGHGDLPVLCLGLLFGMEPRRGSHVWS